MVGRNRRGLFAVLLGAALAAGLAGCNLNWEIRGPYSLGVQDGQFLLAVCESIEIDSIRVSEDLQDSNATSTHLIWEASGPLTVNPGRILIVGAENEGLTNVAVAKPARLSEVRYLRVRVNEGQRAELAASIYIPDHGLAEGEWATPTGEIRDVACLE
ncbi:MAG: hypothetical protein ACQEW8_07195 [Actinomycetota bacterium]